jgi:hypothetical protein
MRQRKPQPYWTLPQPAREHVDRICASMKVPNPEAVKRTALLWDKVNARFKPQKPPPGTEKPTWTK